VIENAPLDSDLYQNLITSTGSSLAHAYHVWLTSINVLVSYLAHRMTDKHHQSHNSPLAEQLYYNHVTNCTFFGPKDKSSIMQKLLINYIHVHFSALLPAGLRVAVLFLLTGPKMGHVAQINVKVGTGERTKGPLPRANFHVYRGKNVGIQPPKLAKFRILARNLYLRGDSFAIFLRNSQRLYASIGSF